MARVGLGALARGRSYAISGFANYLSAHRCEDFYDVASGLRKSGQVAQLLATRVRSIPSVSSVSQA